MSDAKCVEFKMRRIQTEFKRNSIKMIRSSLNTQSWSRSIWGLSGLLSSLGLVLIGGLDVGLAQAQIQPDTTLPEPSRVLPTATGVEIQGGTRRSESLFHSFREFSIPTGQEAFFATDAGIERVLSRVTGDRLSRLDGLLRTAGAVDFFLINPNGIVFGPNARLDVGGSFVASTATALQLANGTTFDAVSPNVPSLLTLNVPVGLQFGRPGTLRLEGPGHTLTLDNPSLSDVDGAANSNVIQGHPGGTIALVASDIELVGGLLGLTDGAIGLGAVGTQTFLPIPSNVSDLVPVFATLPPPVNVEEWGSVRLSDRAVIDASGEGGGVITVFAGDVQLVGDSRILSNTYGDRNGSGIVLGVDRLTVRDRSYISSSTFAAGQAGDLKVTANTIEMSGVGSLADVLDVLFSLTVEDPSQIGSGLFASSFGTGDAGRLQVRTGNLLMGESSFISTAANAAGRGGVLDVVATDTILLDGAEIFADSFGSGNAGDVTVQGRVVQLINGGGVFASAFSEGNGGDLYVQATEQLQLLGGTPEGRFNSAIVANSYANATGNGGNILVTAPVVELGGGASIGSATFGEGMAGDVVVRASKLLDISNQGVNELTNINTRSQGTGSAGSIELSVGRLRVRDGALVFTSTLNAGDAGRVTVQATEGVEIVGRSREGSPSALRSDATVNPLFEGTADPSPSPANVLGASGDVTITTPELILRDGAEMVVSSSVTGVSAGNLTLNVDRLLLDRQARLAAEPATGTGGNIFVNGRQVEMRRGSLLTTNASGDATGGSIFITTDSLVALENSDITANAIAGRGGRVVIAARAIFGTEFRDALTPESDITATSELGAEFSGTVEIGTPEVDPSSGLLTLPATPADPSNQIQVGCAAAEGNSFVAVGRGGLPEDPADPAVSGLLWRDWQSYTPIASDRADAIPSRSVTSRSTPSPTRAAPDTPLIAAPATPASTPPQDPARSPQLLEARAWQRLDDGQLALVAPQAIAATDPCLEGVVTGQTWSDPALNRFTIHTASTEANHTASTEAQ
jgi:filamentous hemagglutinin family protein